jgi:hypothetical protein
VLLFCAILCRRGFAQRWYWGFLVHGADCYVSDQCIMVRQVFDFTSSMPMTLHCRLAAVITGCSFVRYQGIPGQRCSTGGTGFW